MSILLAVETQVYEIMARAKDTGGDSRCLCRFRKDQSNF